MNKSITLEIVKKDPKYFGYIWIIIIILMLSSIWVYFAAFGPLMGLLVMFSLYQTFRKKSRGQITFNHSTVIIQFENEPELKVGLDQVSELTADLHHYQYEPPHLGRIFSESRNYSGYENSIRFKIGEVEHEYLVFIKNATRLEKIRDYFMESK
ncbi:hypothetical protein KFE94_01920 [bacterium SCSIO 12643]|nr:hypothetical protein KFE94_01920 [bacterium SCSIO 12643]